MTAALVDRIAGMARKVIISTRDGYHFMIVDFRTLDGRRYDFCYSENNKPARYLLHDLQEILPDEPVTGYDCEQIIQVWAERAQQQQGAIAND